MKLKAHVLLELLIFLVLQYFFGLFGAAAITLAHFIPTIDYAMLKLNIKGELHRQLFHNIFIAVIAGALLYYFFGFTLASLGFLNILLHFILDLRKGVVIFFPFSKHRLRLRRVAT
jgi:membrane-bound metal-dependent hydrolase YbcI (DUF457 family)